MENIVLEETKSFLVKSDYSIRDRQVNTYIAQANRFEFLRKYKKSREFYRRIQKHFFDNKNIWNNFNNIGLSYFYDKQYDKAIEYFKKAIGIDSTNIIAKHNLALVYMANNDFASAATIEEELERLQSDNPYILAGIGCYYKIAKKDVNSSIKYFTRAIENNFPKSAPYQDLTYLYGEQKKDYEKVITIYNEASTKGFGNDPFLLNNTAYALIKNNQSEEAVPFLEQIDLSNVEIRARISAIATRGLYFLYKGNIEKGIELYQEAINISDDELKPLVTQKYLFEIGNYYFKKSSYSNALEKWQEALKIKIEDKFFDYKKDIIDAMKNLEMFKMEYLANEEMILTRYREISLFLLAGLALSFYVYFSFRFYGEKILGINPFYAISLIVAFCVWLLTCITNMIYHWQLIRRQR